MQTLGTDRETSPNPDKFPQINLVNSARNLSVPALYELAMRREEGVIALGGSLAVTTGRHTGRSANDKFFVKEQGSEQHINWGKVNKPFDPARFDALYDRVRQYLETRPL